jgi:hypothetical protein
MRLLQRELVHDKENAATITRYDPVEEYIARKPVRR